MNIPFILVTSFPAYDSMVNLSINQKCYSFVERKRRLKHERSSSERNLQVWAE